MILAFKIALRNCLRRPRRSILTSSTLVAGYFVLSLVFSITEGSYNVIIEKFTTLTTGHLQIHAPKFREKPSVFRTILNKEELYKVLKEKKSIKTLAPRVISSALIHSEKRTLPISVVGIDPKLEDQLTNLSKRLVKGTYLNNKHSSHKEKKVLLDERTAKILKLDIDQELILISGAADGSIANDRFFIAGIIKSLEEASTSSTVYLPLRDAQEFYALGGRIHELVLQTDSHKNAHKLANKLSQDPQLKDYEIASWQEIAKEFYRSMIEDKKNNIIVVLIIMILVGLSTLNALLMSVMERIKEYGLMLALGTPVLTIAKIIFSEAFILTGLGLSFGIFITLPFNFYLSHEGWRLPQAFEIGGMQFDRIIGEVSAMSLFLPIGIIISTALFSTLIPIWTACSQAPAQTMRSKL